MEKIIIIWTMNKNMFIEQIFCLIAFLVKMPVFALSVSKNMAFFSISIYFKLKRNMFF